MKFGVRECCDVVLRAKGAQKVGNKIFYKNEPVIYFDTLKTTSLEGSATTVYAQGGKGNARLMSWDGERTLTWTMEDALISPVGLMILTGAGLVEPTSERSIKVHTTEQLVVPESYGRPDAEEEDGWSSGGNKIITLSESPYDEANNADTDGTDQADDSAYATGDFIYVMRLDSNGDIATEPFIATKVKDNGSLENSKKIMILDRYRADEAGHKWEYHTQDYTASSNASSYENAAYSTAHTVRSIQAGDTILVDYYREVKNAGGAQEINITPDKFGGNYYLEASTLFRNEDGIDMPAEFIIPNCRIQSNFTFSMSSSGDPSSFTFTMDCFPDYTRWNTTQKVLATIQVINEGTGAGNELMRLETNHHGNYVYEDEATSIVHDTRFEAARKAADEAATSALKKGVKEGQVDGYAGTATADSGTINYNPTNS